MAAFNNQLCRQSSSTVSWATLAAILQGSHCWFWACWGFFCYIGDKKTSSKQWVTAWNKFSHESKVESQEARVSRFNSNYRLEKVMEEKCWLFWTVTAFQEIENRNAKNERWLEGKLGEGAYVDFWLLIGIDERWKAFFCALFARIYKKCKKKVINIVPMIMHLK